ncbi:MAG TPA: glycosyltransferase family 4 protein [Flavobacterium sp.]|nr:glycosyltransferase family 4 protein [Flavobacterium sp.]
MELNKKIAIICNYQLLPERVGGMDYFFWDFDKKCKENGIEIDWFFPNKSNHGRYSELTIHCQNNENIENSFLDFCKINKVEYTHIITHFLELCTPFFYKVKQLSNAKIIAVDHNPRPIAGYSLKKKIQKKVKGILFSRYIDFFIGVSNYTVKELIKDFGIHIEKKTITIYNGIALNNVQVRHNRNVIKPSFLTASHLRESKGIQDLIQAVSLLPETIKNEIVIDIYGDGAYRLELEKLITSLVLEKNFNFKGSSSVLKSIYCNYDYMLQPTHMECFSLSILESLAANVPVVTTNVGGNEEVVLNNFNGYVFKPQDINVLKGILEDVYLGNKTIEINTRQTIEDYFSLEKMLNKHLALIQNNKC